MFTTRIHALIPGPVGPLTIDSFPPTHPNAVEGHEDGRQAGMPWQCTTTLQPSVKRLLRLSAFDFRPRSWCAFGIISFSKPTMQYKVRYTIWKMDADTPEQAKKDLCEIMRKMPEKFISVEPLENKRSIWLRLLTGH